MSPKPTGCLRGEDLVLTRAFKAGIDDVWTSITSSESTARWFGPWERCPEKGEKEIRVQMALEKGQPWIDATIETCEAPRLLSLRSHGDYGARYTLTLTESAGTTTLEFVHHAIDRKMVGDMGPGWEYYLDCLVAARNSETLPTFETYYPAQKEFYAGLA